MAVTLNLSADQLRLLRNAAIYYREMLDKLPSSLVAENIRIVMVEELSRAEVMLDNQLAPDSFAVAKPTVQVHLFRKSGKWYTDERWRIPEGAIGPSDMERSPDFRRIDDGPVLVPSQEPWGFSALILPWSCDGSCRDGVAGS